MLGLPEGKEADGLADVLIDGVNGLPALMRGALTWDRIGEPKWPATPT
ncbi:hypothetical protein QFZ79_002816 [Arthrobacter sp. V4I6]|nr:MULTISPECIES: hypothetical protein [unclassified Arthrobacter]MDQ0820524.1 hypothetical protein [Arthrobacter sp. V1I7]MDQ0854705.1 hypothetical protein [Arthrobacter sp. V4I6]